MRFICFLLLLCSCEENSELTRVGGQHCYTEEDGSTVIIKESSLTFKRKNVGSCKTGLVQVGEDDSCVGEVLPTIEICDGVDNNCDGFVDNSNLLNKKGFTPENFCAWGANGVCQQATTECIDGVYTCVMPATYGEEVCNGKKEDEDCDGLVDEDTAEDPIFNGDRSFYPSDPSTINVGECRLGYKVCVNGSPFYRGLTTPVREVCGDNLDNDCDGLSDENSSTQEADYLLVVDFSGSMYSYISYLADTLCEWSAQGVLADSRFAVIGIGYAESTTIGPQLQETKLLTDFVDSGVACSSIRRAARQATLGRNEFVLDAVIASMNPQHELKVSWLKENKRIITFTDEPIKAVNDIDALVSNVKNTCENSNINISAFIADRASDAYLWQEIAGTCNGTLSTLDDDSNYMIQQLNMAVTGHCSE